MRAAIESGESYRAIAKRFKVGVAAVAHARSRFGIAPRLGHERNATRDAFISNQLLSGKTLEEVGTALGISRERVRQIANATGIDKQARKAAVTDAHKVDWACKGCDATARLSPSAAKIRRYSKECGHAHIVGRQLCPHGHILAPWNQRFNRPRSLPSCRACNAERVGKTLGRSPTVLPKYNAQAALHNAGWTVEVTNANRIEASLGIEGIVATCGMGRPWRVQDVARGRYLGEAADVDELLYLLRRHIPIAA